MNKRYATQWIGQFGVASELARRNYLVSLTLGNAPIRDMLCQSPNGENFAIQVKSLTTKTYFPFQDILINKKFSDLHLVFVYIPAVLNQSLEYFVLTHSRFLEIWKEEQKEWAEKEKLRAKPYEKWSNGIQYKTLLKSSAKNDWSDLPR
ncbi:MAG: hypothetical protein Q8N14_00885 [Candidatus Omnitrophota bacterium]|nr:hypothetical protein [Candidatus Omnitrophota bacterium]